MPDYNPDNIPVLDDIIEEGITDKAEKNKEDGFVESDDVVTEATFDINLFLAESDSDAENTNITETGPQLGDLNSFLDVKTDTTEAVQYSYEEIGKTDVFFSEDIDEAISDNTDPMLTEYYADEDDEDDYESIIDVQSDEPASQVSAEPISVGLLVKDIIKELMPELEQQLVFLLQKAIEEKLPKEIVKSSGTDHDMGDEKRNKKGNKKDHKN